DRPEQARDDEAEVPRRARQGTHHQVHRPRSRSGGRGGARTGGRGVTGSKVHHLDFRRDEIEAWAKQDPQLRNWPVVYVLDGARRRRTPALYVGETVSAVTRMRQHLGGSKRDAGLESVRVIVDDRFNKSVCLDLESHLIRWFHGDGRFDILNGNDGLTDAQYYDREIYRESFRDIFEQL